MTGPTTRMSRQQLVDRLNRELMDHTLRPGSRLPSERELADRFQISRPVVREVLRQMQERGLVEIEPGRGAFVRAVGTMDAARVSDGLYRRGQATPRHLVDARAVLECRAVALAATEATEQELTAMARALKRFDEATGVIERAQADIAFHTLVARASHNPVIELMFGSIGRFVVEMMLRSLDDPSVVAHGAPQHHKILAALKKKDHKSASKHMNEHIMLAVSLYGDDLDLPLDTIARRKVGDIFDSGISLDEVIAAALRYVDEVSEEPLIRRT